MKAIFAALLLFLAVATYGKLVKAHFVLQVPSLKYNFDGYAYVNIGDMTGWVDLFAPVEARFEGTFKDETGAEYSSAGTVTVPDPPLSHLNDIRVSGHYDSNPAATTFEGVFKVSVWDILKPKIPFVGHLKFSNGKEGDASGLVDKPVFERPALIE